MTLKAKLHTAMKVLITGATGFVGSQLCQLLADNGHSLVVLTRNLENAKAKLGDQHSYYEWKSCYNLAPAEAFNGVELVINLAGEPIASGRWTARKKQALYDSRINGTDNLIQVMKTLENKPHTFISASAVGIYGNRGDDLLTEYSVPADDFLARLCSDWEATALKAKVLGIRTCLVRIGVVLGKEGGALATMLTPFKLGLGGPIGSGSQWMSCIHVKDLVRLFAHLAETSSAQGIFNGTAPTPCTNKQFTKSLAKALSRPAIFTAPPFILKLALGEMSQILTDSQRVVPKNIKNISFECEFKTIEEIFADLFKHS